MTIQGNFKAPSLPSLKPATRPTGKPSGAGTTATRPTTVESSTPAPTLPTGLVGNHVDTTA